MVTLMIKSALPRHENMVVLILSPASALLCVRTSGRDYQRSVPPSSIALSGRTDRRRDAPVDYCGPGVKFLPIPNSVMHVNSLVSAVGFL